MYTFEWTSEIVRMTFRFFIGCLFFGLLVSCVNTKNTIQNIDDSAPLPLLTAENTFLVTEYSTDKRYGYEPNYPINIFFQNTSSDTLNPGRFIRALAGPNGEPIDYKRVESCCPFPTRNSAVGAGFLEVFEISWNENNKPLLLYFNTYEKGKLLIPKGLTLKKATH